jgi:hypothetical protein
MRGTEAAVCGTRTVRVRVGMRDACATVHLLAFARVIFSSASHRVTLRNHSPQ